MVPVTMSNSSASVTTSSVKKELNEIDIPSMKLPSTSTTTKELKHKEQHETTAKPHLANVLTKGSKPIDAEFSKSRHLPEPNGEYFEFSYLQ